LIRHRLAEIDRHAGITAGFGLGGPVGAARRAYADRDPQLAGWEELILEFIGTGCIETPRMSPATRDSERSGKHKSDMDTGMYSCSHGSL
jgi:hypothetical protein